MKKYALFAAMAMTLGMMSSCTDNVDNPSTPATPEEPVVQKTTIELDGVKYEVGTIATLKGQVGSEVSLTLGVYDQFDIYGVDFGDGVIQTDTVCFENGGLKGENGLSREDTNHKSATKFTGTVAGEGIITVYGESDVWYLVTSGGAVPTSFDQEKLEKVVQVNITGADAETIELPKLDSLKQFTFNNSSVKRVDVSKAVNLTSLSINNTSASKFEPQLESIDVSKNTKLTYLSLQGNNKAAGKLKSIDLTNNTKLENLYVQYNQIAEIKLGESYEKLGTINAQNNMLVSLDAAKLTAAKSLYLADNQLKSIDVAKLSKLAWFDVKNNQLEGDMDLTANTKLTNVYVNNNQLISVKVTNVTKQFYFDTNKMTIATMPELPAGMNTTSKKKQFHYAPQADMEVTALDGVVDLSAQASAKGMEEEAVATTFTVKAGGATLVADTDYKNENGKITFLKDQSDVVIEMTTAAYPTLTLKTKAFNVTVTPTR